MKPKYIILIILMIASIVIFVKSTIGRNPVAVPVLTYHNIVVVNYSESTGNITYDKFRADLTALKEEGYNTILFQDLYSYLKDGIPLPPKPILITFDDGYISNYDYAYPLLMKMNMKGSFFVIGWSVGRMARISDNAPIIPHFTWENAQEMVRTGRVEIQSHTFDLHNMPSPSGEFGLGNGYGALKMKKETDWDYRTKVEADFARSVLDITTEAKIPPMVLAYPFNAYDNELSGIARAYFAGTVTMKKEIREYRTLSDLYEMPRIGVKESTDVIEEINRLMP